MKKRILSLLLAVGMILSLTACDKQVNLPSENENAPVATKPAETPTEDTEPEAPVEIDGMQVGTGLVMEEEAAAAMDENPDREIDRAVTPIAPVPDTMLNGTPLGEEFYYYRSTLDDTMKQAYDLIRAGLLEGKTTINMTGPVERSKIFDLYKKVIFDSPDLFWVEVNGMRYLYNKRDIVISITPGYNDLVKDIPGNTAKLEAAAAEALADMWSLPTDAAKAKYAHDYLTHTIEYDMTLVAPYNQTMYSSFLGGKTVCAGYAHAFQYMMQQMGIPCAYVLGYANGGYHAWNVVKLDGEHYAMDVTWDDPIGAVPEKYYYNYFNVTDTVLAADHVRSEISMGIPAAQGTQCSYQNAFGGNAYGTDFNAIVGVMPERISGGSAENVDNPYLG